MCSREQSVQRDVTHFGNSSRGEFTFGQERTRGATSWRRGVCAEPPRGAPGDMGGELGKRSWGLKG